MIVLVSSLDNYCIHIQHLLKQALKQCLTVSQENITTVLHQNRAVEKILGCLLQQFIMIAHESSQLVKQQFASRFTCADICRDHLPAHLKITKNNGLIRADERN